MLFSIVIPVYNVEMYLVECLESIIPQALQINEGCEIILIDDGSTDESGMICDKFKKKYPSLIQVFHRSNHGLLLTRRFGYQHTTGKYIVNCDSDDKLEEYTLETLRKSIIKYNQPDYLIFNYNNLKDENKSVAFTNIFTNYESCRVERERVLKEYLSGYSIISLCCGICRRECIDIDRDYRKFKGLNNGEDSLQKIEQFNRANTFVYINKPLYDYRIGSGMTAKFDPNYYDSFKMVFNELVMQKEYWNFPKRDMYFSLKVLSTTGRAITQSRYKKWDKKNDHIEYLKTICNDDYYKSAILYLSQVKSLLQKDHVVLLGLLKYHQYSIIVRLLNIKNKLGVIKGKK